MLAKQGQSRNKSCFLALRSGFGLLICTGCMHSIPNLCRTPVWYIWHLTRYYCETSPKPSGSFHLLQRLGGLQWGHKAQLQSKVCVLKSTFWVTLGITPLQDTVQICRNLLPRSQYLRRNVPFPRLGEHQGDSHHSQTAITRMLVPSHRFFEADLIYLWPVYVSSFLY